MGDASFGLLALIAIATVSVYKAWGRTRYGEHKQQELRQASAETGDTSVVLAPPDPVNGAAGGGFPLGLKIFLAATGVLVLMFAVVHHSGHSFHHLH